MSQEEYYYRIFYLKRVVPFMEFLHMDQNHIFDNARIKMKNEPHPFLVALFN